MSYKPLLGGLPTEEFPLQFPKSSIHRHSLSCTIIEHLANDGSDQVLSHGSGFFWRHEDKVWLITARHVLSGTSPFDDEPISADTGFIPQRIRIHVGFRDETHTGRIAVEISLRDDADTPRWVQDPLFESLRTDIAAILIAGDSPAAICINDDETLSQPISTELFTYVGFPCVIIGYPTRHVTGLMTPIWRVGSIASEPLLPVDGKPMFMVDAATGPGFSGAPVFRMHVGPAPYHDASQTTGIRVESDAVLRQQFIGVYAGRLSSVHYGSEVPFVFYANRIPLILASGGGSL